MLSGEIAVSSRPLGANAQYSRRYTLVSEINMYIIVMGQFLPTIVFHGHFIRALFCIHIYL